jgi:hypothetical protein
MANETAEALDRMTGGDPGLAAAAMLYANAYHDAPDAVIGMLCVTQGIILERVSDLHTMMMQIKPFVDDPETFRAALMENVPEPFRSLLGM